MPNFFWKFTLCIVPVVLALWATTDATVKYYRGDSGGFKLGVDLVGGTILVYEIDLRKNLDSENKFDPVKDINILAESLKRRIDPNDLYNITIRPAGGEGRIEIILPTGGTHRIKKAEEDWRNLLDELNKEFLGGQAKLEVGRGRVLELADRIQSAQSESRWQKELFSDAKAWRRLQDRALEYWATLDNEPKTREEVLKLKVGDLDAFSKYVLNALSKTTYATTPKTIQNWIKKQAWDETMSLARRNWLVPAFKDNTEYDIGSYVVFEGDIYLAQSRIEKAKDEKTKTPVPPAAPWKLIKAPDKEPFQDEMERINPDNIDQLTSFILTKGAVIGQAGLSLLGPLVGEHVDRIFLNEGPDVKEIHAFLSKHYGPPVQKIMKQINDFRENTGRTKDLSVEEVQRIKDLVSKVGSLEFSILANSNDDKAAIDEAKKIINEATSNSDIANEIAAAAERGLPPPAPREKEGNEWKPKKFDIVTVRNSRSTVTYSWVELGPQERRALNLDNAARTEPGRNNAWHEARKNRNKAEPIPEFTGSAERFILQGALFYSRECKDRNLPEEERRKKEIEYFVLRRDPEFNPDNPGVRTPKIDGSYLTGAYGAPGQDMRPTVHFTFNNAGGELFGNLTRKNVSEGTGPESTQRRRHLAIILDGLVMSAPTINSEIRTQGQISGNFTQKEVDSLVNILRAGRLPATLKPQPVSESTIGATLGEDTIVSGVRAIALSFAAVLLFMIVYYRFAGLVASIALLANLLFTIGFMVAVQATFTLSGLAGLVLTVGMAVDANILIYERLREERERGASLLQAIRNGYDRALPAILDSNLTTILTAIILYVVGNDNLKGFSVSLIVGLVASLFTSIFMTRVIFDFAVAKGWLTKLTMMRLLTKTDIDFMGIRHVMLGVTAALAIIGLALFVGRIPNDLNIDFVGGTAYGGQLTKGKTIEKLRELVDNQKQKEVLSDVQVQQVDDEGRRFEILYPNGDNVKHVVSFSNIPESATKEGKEAIVKKRASMLPEPGVELLYNSTDVKEINDEIARHESRNFVIRTTEREAELVQTCLDQLLRTKEDGPLLKKVFARADALGSQTRETRLQFFATPEDARDKAEPTATASPSFVKSLLNRELRRAFDVKDDKAPLPFLFEINGEGSSDRDGKFSILKVSFGNDLKEEDFPKVAAALDKTVTAFSARPLPDRLENFDSSLADQTRFRAIWAVLASWAGILLYLWFRFGTWTFGLAAITCIAHDVFLTLGVIAACYFVHDTFIGSWLLLDDFKLDLVAVAALLTLVGYSVNDKIVVFDRIREVRGKNPDLTLKMLNDSINQTLSRTVLTSLTIAVVFVLYVWGGPGLHLFAFIMLIGVVVGTYSSIYIAAPLLLLFGEGKHDDAPTPTGMKPTPEGAVV